METKINNNILSSFELNNLDMPETWFDIAEYQEGQLIYCEGNTPLGIYVVNSGKVKITKRSHEGKEQIIQIAGKGNMLDFKSLMLETRYTTTAMALEDTTLYFIPKQDFFKIIKKNKNLQNELMRTLCTESLQTEQKMVDLAYKPVRGRLADILLTLNNKYKGEDGNAQIYLSRYDLACLIGTVQETVVRLLSEFKKENLVRLERKGVKITNPDGLMRVSNYYS